jgi:hypothetical protein
LALNRKNALFAGSHAGGEYWAVLASLVETCKLNGIEPNAYLADVLSRLVNAHPNSRINELLPWAYVACEHRLPTVRCVPVFTAAGRRRPLCLAGVAQPGWKFGRSRGGGRAPQSTQGRGVPCLQLDRDSCGS